MTWWQVAAAVPLVGAAVAAAAYQRLGLTRDLVTAAIRAAVQLAAVGAVLLLLFAHAAIVGMVGWIAVMLLIAGQVAGRRGRAVPRARILATIAIAAGSLPVLVALTVFGVLAVRAEVMIPISGMVIATAMQASGLTLVRLAEDVRHHRPAIETRLALGMPATTAFVPHRRSAVRTALLPAIVVHEGVVESAELRIYEPPRFFEALLRGRAFTEPPDSTSRICGICPVAYQVSACNVLEQVCGAELDPPLRALRRLLYCGEWIARHCLHIFLLHLPDFLGFPDAVALARTERALVEQGLALKKAGNALLPGQVLPAVEGGMQRRGMPDLPLAEMLGESGRGERRTTACPHLAGLDGVVRRIGDRDEFAADIGHGEVEACHPACNLHRIVETAL